MLEIDMEMIKCMKCNASVRLMRSQIFRKLRKMKNFKIFRNFLFFENFIFLKRHSTSPPCGNQVDGLPHDVHTETVAKPGRLGPAKNGDTPP